MGYGERNAWVQLVGSVIAGVVYGAIFLSRLADSPAEEVSWAGPMLMVIVGGIVVTMLSSIGWGIVAGLRDPDEEHRADQRDREIEWFGDRVGQAFLVLGGMGALVLAAYEVHWVWIGQTLFFSSFLSAVVGGAARLVAYRRGFQ